MDMVAVFMEIWFFVKGDFSHFLTENNTLSHYKVKILPEPMSKYLFSANRQF